MIAGKKYESLKVDIWSTGVILYALLCGCLPFEDQNTSQLYKKILSGEFQIPDFLSPEAKNILKKILITDPDKRADFEILKKDPWFSLYKRKSKIAPGIIVGYNQIPVDQKILDELAEKYDFERENTEKCIDANKHNHITTSYYLLLSKYLKQGGTSHADLNSSEFDIKLLEPKKRPAKCISFFYNLKKFEIYYFLEINTLMDKDFLKQFNKENNDLIQYSLSNHNSSRMTTQVNE